MKCALIDSLALTYSSKYAIPKLYTNDEPTGIIFGFIKYLLALQKQFQFDQFLFCFDSRSSKRKEIYPKYKFNRNLNDIQNLVYSQVDIIQKEILPSIGFKNSYQTTGLEADDIIGSLCKNKNPEDEYIIISRDHDLYQLLNTNVAQYDYISKTTITLDTFLDKYNIHPKQFGIVKAISGCKTDNVIGIQKIGEKSAIKYLNHQLKQNTKAYQKIISDGGQSLIKFNEKLVVLPFDGTPEYGIVEDEIQFEKLKEIFIRYDFQSQLTERSLNEWRESFDWIDVKKRKTQLSDFF